ncbi:MAG TPA: ATPase domain-containing protein [Nannocystaceae bacterium]|nr:ATPase domain-containing protein [Nannocystaceae bacterium]
MDELSVADTGIPGLDDILGGGLPRGHLYLLVGEPGAGKTTLALQFLLAGAAQGETCLYIALSETRRELDQVAASHGWQTDRLAIHELTTAERAPEDGSPLFDPGELDLHETTSTLLAAVERLRPTRVVFDSLAELRMLAPSAQRYRRQVLGLRDYFIGRNTTVLLIDDERSESTDMQLRTVAHGVLALELLTPDYGVDRRRLRIAKLRGVKYRAGNHDFVIERGGLTVFPRLVASEHHTPFASEPASSGITELDQLVGGGFDRGTSTLLLGPAGSGKSAIASACALAAAQRGERPALYLFDENRRTFLMRSRSLGMEFDRQLERGALTLRQVDPAELSPGELAAALRQQVEEQGCRFVMIDSLNGYLTAMPGERYLVIQMHELLMYMAQRGVTTFLVVAQHGLLDASSAPVDLTYLADTVLCTRYFEARGEVRKAVSVLKKRSGRHENSIRELRLGADGVSVGAPLTGFHGVMTGVPRIVGAARTSSRDEPTE